MDEDVDKMSRDALITEVKACGPALARTETALVTTCAGTTRNSGPTP